MANLTELLVPFKPLKQSSLTRWSVIPSMFVLTVTDNSNVRSTIKLFYFDPKMNSYICYPRKIRCIKRQHFNQNVQSVQLSCTCRERMLFVVRKFMKINLAMWWDKVWKIHFFLWGSKGWNNKCQTIFSFVITSNPISYHGHYSSWPWLQFWQNMQSLLYLARGKYF